MARSHLVLPGIDRRVPFMAWANIRCMRIAHNENGSKYPCFLFASGNVVCSLQAWPGMTLSPGLMQKRP
jgi:hypothetical protein